MKGSLNATVFNDILDNDVHMCGRPTYGFDGRMSTNFWSYSVQFVIRYYVLGQASVRVSQYIAQCSLSLQYAAKEYQQALDILDVEEPASKKLLDKGLKEESGTRETAKEWEMSPTSVSPSPLLMNI